MDLWTNKPFVTGEDTKDLMIEAVNEIAEVVVSTMGPKGRTVIIPDSKEYGKYTITKDGVSVAKAFKSDNDYKNIVANLVKQVAEETVKEAGDGTTTSILLTQLFVNEENIKFNKEDDQFIDEVVRQLKVSAKPLLDTDVYNIAKISANGDDTIADNIFKTFRTKNSLVNVKKGNSDEDIVAITSGYYIPNGPIFNVVSKANVEYAKLLVVGENMTDVGRYSDILNRGRQGLIVIVAPHVDDIFYRTVSANNLQVVFIKAPGFADHRENLLNDLAKAANTKVITIHDKKVNADNLAHIAQVSFNNKETFFTLGLDNCKQEVIKELEIERSELFEDYSKELIDQRIARLNGEVSTIFVGGLTEAEQNERFDRYEDAVLAVKCAFEEGYIKGGGVGLMLVTQNLANKDNKHITNLLKTPYLKLSKDNGFTHITINDDVIDPVKVTITALTRAYNFAKVLRSTKSIIK